MSEEQHVMSCLNTSSHSHPAAFLLLGIPGLQEAQFWIAFPFCTMFVIALLGNVIVLFIIHTEPSLHQPMYLFLAVLAVTDLVLATATVPKMLSVFWRGPREIGFHACLVQMFFVHAFSAVESGVLMAMALDRYVAICWPLRHSAVLSIPAVVSVGGLVLARGVLLVSPFSLLIRRLPFCHRCLIPHSYCEHMAVVKLACRDAGVSVIYGLFVAFMVVGGDVFVIAVSYAMILQAVLRLPGTEARLKAVSTCTAHFCVILAFYIPGLFTFLAHRFGHNVPQHVHILVANLYLLVPPTLNPLVYGVRTRQIRDRVLRVFQQTGFEQHEPV